MKFKNILFVFVTTLLVLTAVIIPLQSVHASTTNPISRSQVEERALKMINLQWTYSKYRNANISSTYSSKVTLPNQFNGVTYKTMTGIPYNWGGSDSLDSSSYNTPWSDFLSAIEMGAHVGNTNSSGGIGYVPGTVGLDCSGFIQAAYNIPGYKLSTSTLMNKHFYEISLNDIKRMDIFVKPGDHAVIFDRWGYKNGVYGAYTYESTPNQYFGGVQGTKKYFRTMNELSKYTPARYVNVVESTTSTPTNKSTNTDTIKPGIFAKVINVNSWANFRNGPSTRHSIIGTIPKDAIIYLKDYSYGWYKVAYNGKIGWLWGNLVGLLDSGKYVTVKDVYSLNVRTYPGTSSRILTTIDRGEYAKVIGYSSDGYWYKIELDGIIGWSSGRYLNYIY